MKQKGFTLIELLVVISIIGLLASIVLVSLNPARGKARDAKRLADKTQVITALNLYYNNNGSWPLSGGTWKCFGLPTSGNCWVGSLFGLNSIITDMQPYMASFPTNNADFGTLAYNHLLYAGPAFVPSPGWPAGAYLVWVQENAMPASICPSPIEPQPDDKYWYCYEYLGP